MKEVYIVSAARTPMGSFGGALAGFSATELGSIAIKGAISKTEGLDAKFINEVIMGNVVSANLGQAPARQAAIGAGVPYNVPCTTVNKVCASGMKAVALAAQNIMIGITEIAVAGGMESMSNIPYYIPKARFGYKFGHGELVDGLSKDGLTDVYDQLAMGVSADATAKKYKISREEQDRYAIQSYKRASEATSNGSFQNEIVPVTIKSKKGDIQLTEDEEYKNVFFDKIPGLRPAFTKDGTVTAANASTINDGASVLILASEKAVKKYGLKPIAKIAGFADAEQEPKWFTTTPTKAAPLALKRAKMTMKNVDFLEINEAFAVVPMAFAQLMDVQESKMNVFGGAVALGHPLGSSGSRILCTLVNVLQKKDANVGLAAICNGGGGASAMVIERT
ncbi:MAG: acetyl-CoA C-acyltransferase [Saprospiraceae bacterium]